MKLFILELKRFFLSKKNRYLLGIISLLVLGYGLYQTIYVFNTVNRTGPLVMRQNIQVTVNSMTAAVDNIDNLIKNSKQTQEIESLEASKRNIQKSLTIAQNQVKAINQHDYNEFYNLQEKADKIEVEQESKNAIQAQANQGSSNILKNDLAYFEAVRERQLNFEMASNEQSHSFGNFQQQFLPLISSSLFVVLFSSMVSITIATGFEGKESRFYYFAGVNPTSSLFAKVGSGLLTTYIWLVVAALVYFLIIGFINGFGAWNYPAYLDNNITIANALVDGLSLLYLFPVMLFLASLGALISVIAKRSLVVIGSITILVLGYSMIENVKWVKPLRRFIPMSYLDPRNLLTNPSYLFGRSSMLLGLIYLLLISAICLILANSLLKSYKIRRI